jgi:23S rRNA (adenine2030-N6)-methyltransferase
LQQYPGSPIIAERLLRDIDEHRLCDCFVEEVKGVKNSPAFQQGDSFHPDAVEYFLPQTKMHPVVFIDPSYVDPEDFFRARKLMEAILDKNPYATVILWYPMISGNKYRYNYIKTLKEMVQKKGKVGHYSAWVTVQKDDMQGSCVFIANPTKQFDEIVDEECLDWLSAILLKAGRSDFGLDQWMKKPKV